MYPRVKFTQMGWKYCKTRANSSTVLYEHAMSIVHGTINVHTFICMYIEQIQNHRPMMAST